MTDEDYMISLAISFASSEGIKGALIPCTKSRDSSNIMTFGEFNSCELGVFRF